MNILLETIIISFSVSVFSYLSCTQRDILHLYSRGETEMWIAKNEANKDAGVEKVNGNE